MPQHRPLVIPRRVVGGLMAAVVLLGGAGAWQLAQSQADSRASLRDRFADRAPVATSVVDGLFRSIFTGQAQDLDPTVFGAPRVGTAALDAMARRGKNVYVVVTDARGRVVGASTGAPRRPPGLERFERQALRRGYGLSDVQGGRVPTLLNAVRFATPSGPRLLVSASPEKAYAEFLQGTLKPLVRSADDAAFLLDGRGQAIAAVPRRAGPVGSLGRMAGTRRSGEVSTPRGPRFFAAAPVGGSSWRTVLTVPESALYAPAGGLGQWLPWAILGLLVTALLGAAWLVRRLSETGSRLSRSNNELELANANLARSNADLEQFAYVASHDLSSPLRSVAGFSQMLAKRYRGRLDAEADTWIGYVEQGVGRMQRVIDDLLLYSRVDREETRPEPVDLEEVLDEVRRSLGPQLEESGGELTHGPLPVVLAEHTHMLQVLQNLVGNALTYVAPGVEPHVDVAARREGGRVRISVTDNGLGIDPEHVDRIFKMFQRLHAEDEHPGTGIGLAIAKKIVERYGGQIEVTAAPGGGSTFGFTVPAAPVAAPRREREKVLR